MFRFKLHLIKSVSGAYANHIRRPAAQHDSEMSAELAESAIDGALPDDLHVRLESRLLLADKVYIDEQLKLDYTIMFKGKLKALFRSNSKIWEPTNPYHQRARRYIETIFSRLSDEVRIKPNRAKRYSGLAARVSKKLLTKKLKQWVNYHLRNY